MKIYDISLPISKDTVVWPGDPAIEIKRKLSIDKGNICNVSSISLGVHTGTHIDAPFHFINDGKKVESINLDSLIGVCKVIEINDRELIKKEYLVDIDFEQCTKVLFKTKNSHFWKENKKVFSENFVSLGESASIYLIENGIKLIGIDYLSIEAFETKDASVHKLLLSNEIIILEGLDLSDITPGDYKLICMPLKLEGCDGAPVRAILIDKKENLNV